MPPPAQGQTTRGALAVVAPDGSCTLHLAPPGAQAEVVAVLTTEAEALHGLGARLLADAAVMRLAPARERVPQFGDWAYGWVQSYVTSYRVLARGFVGVAHSVALEGEAPLIARIAEEMAEPIRNEFHSRVLASTLWEGSYADDLAHVGGVLDQAWAEALIRAASPLAALPLASQGTPIAYRLHFAAAGQPVAPVLTATAPADPMALVAEEGTDTGTVFVRSIRPMAARLGAVLVRISEAGSIVATGGAFGFALGGFPGTAIGVVGGVGASWALDWLFNKLDATLNRSAFEAQALEAIDRAEQRLTAAAERIVGSVLAARVVALGAEGGCK